MVAKNIIALKPGEIPLIYVNLCSFYAGENASIK
jgi:hypothetical protein